MALSISRILHAGYQFQCGDTKILFDPIFENPFSRNCFAFPSVNFDCNKIRELQIDAVFISHYHDDHCSFESLDYLDRQTPIYLYCEHEEIFGWLRELGFRKVIALELNGPVVVGDIEVIPRAALDPDVDSIFEIHGGGMSLLNVVDSWLDPRTLPQLRSTRWDMVLWPFQTMREVAVLAPAHAEPAEVTLPPEWLDQLKMLNPRYMVPGACQFIHEPWSWYNEALFPITYRQFEKEVGDLLPETQVIRLNPSESVRLSSDGLAPLAPLAWVTPQGSQDVDYEFNPKVILQTTAEIAKKFSALTPEEYSAVNDYCLSDILEKYRSMPPPQDEYFDNPRVWKLSVFDHEGIPTHFYYLVHQDKIDAVAKGAHVDWLTELPAQKFSAALNHGEALTSMYLRVEALRKDIDVMEDPLIRCLFTGAFGGYQREQMRKLMNVRDESDGHRHER